jgi:hypothetical protein
MRLSPAVRVFAIAVVWVSYASGGALRLPSVRVFDCLTMPGAIAGGGNDGGDRHKVGLVVDRGL